MKKIIVITMVILSCIVQQSSAQTWNEWFKQKKTQRKYLIKQIAALRIYLKYVKEGYSIAKKGLTTISDVKEGDLNLHQDYFGSLKLVNPLIKNSAKVSGIAAYQVQIMGDFERIYKRCKDDKNFTPDEIQYISQVYNGMMRSCNESLDELLTVVTDHQSEMKDDERLRRIDTIYDDMKDKYTFMQAFGNSTLLLAIQRSKDNSEINILKKQYGVS